MSSTEAVVALKSFFGPDRGETAAGIFLCLIHGDNLPKEQFAGVRVQEVKETAKLLGYKM